MSGQRGRAVVSVAVDAGCVVDAPAAERLAALVEAAGVDFLVLGTAFSQTPAMAAVDALVLAGWLASRLPTVGVVPLIHALHAEPFHVARALSALDFLTGGNSGWQPTSWQPKAGSRPLAADDVLPKAVDFIAATRSLWDSWDDDALVIDQASGVYLHADRVRRNDHRGRYFRVLGPLNAARPPQGHPVLIQDTSDPLWHHTLPTTDVLLVNADENDETMTFCGDTRVAANNDGLRLLLKLSVEQFNNAMDKLSSWVDRGVIDGVHLILADPREELSALAEIGAARWQRTDRACRTPVETLRARLGCRPIGAVHA